MLVHTPPVAALCGIDVNVRVQLVWLCDLPMFTPQAVGVPPGPEMSPETDRKSTPPNTSDHVTTYAVARTDDTACSSLRMMLLMFSPSCGIRRGSDRGAPTLINVSRLIFELENYPGLTGWDQSLDRSRGWRRLRSVYSTSCARG